MLKLARGPRGYEGSPLRENGATGSDLPKAKSSRSAHRSKHNEKTVIFPLFCNKSQTPSAFTCSPALCCVIPTIPEVCDSKVSTNYSWCSSSIKWRNRTSWQRLQRSGRWKTRIGEKKMSHWLRLWNKRDVIFAPRLNNRELRWAAEQNQALEETEVWMKIRSPSPPSLPVSPSLSLCLTLPRPLLPPSRQTRSHSWSVALLFHRLFLNPTLDSDPSNSVH